MNRAICSALVFVMGLTSAVPARAANVEFINVDGLEVASAAQTFPACQEVYEKKLKGLKRREKIQNILAVTGAIPGAGAGVAFGLINVGKDYVVLQVIGAAIGGVMGFYMGAGALWGLTFLVTKDWKKKKEVAGIIMDQSIQLSFQDLVTIGHQKAIEKYDEKIRKKAEEINADRAEQGAGPLTLAEVAALYPMKTLTDADRAISMVDIVAEMAGVGVKQPADFESYRLKLRDLIYSEEMCPQGKPIGLKKAKALIKAL